MIKQRIMPIEIPGSSKFVTWGHTTWVIFRVKIFIFERSNEKTHFSETNIYFRKKTTPQLFGYIGLQNMKIGEKTNLSDLPLFVWCMLTLALKCLSARALIAPHAIPVLSSQHSEFKQRLSVLEKCRKVVLSLRLSRWRLCSLLNSA